MMAALRDSGGMLRSRMVNHQISVEPGPWGRRKLNCVPLEAIHRFGKMLGWPRLSTPTTPSCSCASGRSRQQRAVGCLPLLRQLLAHLARQPRTADRVTVFAERDDMVHRGPWWRADIAGRQRAGMADLYVIPVEQLSTANFQLQPMRYF